MRKRTSDYYSSDTEQMAASEDIGAKVHSIEYQDIYLMRPQTKLTFESSFKEAKHFYDTGDEEVQQLLLKECRLIYECKLCRNMFRNLTQFIGHKREFCRSAVHCDGDISEVDKYNGFASDVMVTKEICSNINSRCESVLQITDEAVQQTRTHCESNELMDEKISEICSKQALEKNGNEKIKNILSCPQEHCMLNFSNTKELELHFSQDHTKSMVFTSFAEQKVDNPNPALSEAVVLTRAQHLTTNNCHTCEHCGKTFERIEALSTHLLHCPVKHNILSKTLASANIDSIATKRIKLQAATTEEACNGREAHELGHDVANLSDNSATNMQDAVTVKQEYVPLERSTSGNTSATAKKRKLKNRRVFTNKVDADIDVPTEVAEISPIKQETCNEESRTHAKIKSESSIGSDGSDLEPKKLLSTCTYCGKSFERRAALSTHLQHCPVKYSVIEKSTIYGMNTCSKRSKTLKDTRQQNITSMVTEDPDTELLNEMFANLGRQTFGVGLQTVTIDHDDTTASGTDDAKEDVDLEDNVQINTPTKLNETLPLDQSVTGVEPSVNTTTTIDSSPDANAEEDAEKKSCRRVRSAPLEKRLLCRCKICYKQFNALSNLRRHISMFHYRAQRFGCTLCDYRAFRRYDIVNHLGNTHGMKGDPEAMSIEFVSEHEVNYSREDVEGDIVVLDEDIDDASAINESTEDVVENSIETNQNLKRLKRNKTLSISSGLNVTLNKLTRQKVKRSQSHHETSTSGGVKTPARRPIRNRIKPENKDFVYDLSSLVKKENNDVQNETMRSLRRRNTMNVGTMEPATHCLESLLGPASSWDQIRGAAQRLAASTISSGAATSDTQPELPTERPQMRQRLISIHRADNHSVPVIETSELDAARLQSTLLDDAFLEKVAKASPTSFKIKPLLSLHTSTLNRLLEKVDSSLHQHANGKSSPSETSCSDENVINSMHISPPPSIPKANAPPPTPRKRISMLDRLRDDTFKYRDSLLRSALEN
ncbi:zinc finger protein 800 [Bactrocera oleae]|uniref:zinc finger protein 800 n=1 Tax=Bactrocera oleae TaxID=104688 RepID=UPI00387E2B01